MIKILGSLEEAGKYRLPFLVYKPKAREPYDISVRIHDLKWPSLRYCLRIGGKEVRIKQFFLDWFFPGFPKSMLKDFSSGYSMIRSREVRGYVLFLGRNYRNHDSATIWIHGTMIEMDSSSVVSDDEYERIALDLISDSPDPSVLSKFQFPDRSHFSKGYESQWYEDNRIARLSWRRTDRYSIDLNGRKLVSDGLGYFRVADKIHEIFIFQENNYHRGLWIEVTSNDISLDHAVYDVRKGEGLFDSEIKLADNSGTLIFRKPIGPAVVKMIVDSFVVTAGFSPGTILEEVSAFISRISDILDLLKNINDTVRQADANL